MYNYILTFPKAGLLACTWVSTGNPLTPLACVWVETNTCSKSKEASSSNDESGRVLLCA